MVSGIPESLGFLSVSKEDLSRLEFEILAFVLENWPTSALEIAEHFNEAPDSREGKKRLSTKYSYHLQKLVEKRMLFSKRFGNSLVVWPLDAEKYRTIHSILSGEQ
jgi:hypothetical protein